MPSSSSSSLVRAWWWCCFTLAAVSGADGRSYLKYVASAIAMVQDMHQDLVDQHGFYNSTLFHSLLTAQWWRELDDGRISSVLVVQKGQLRQGRPDLVRLNFSFPFFGRRKSSVTVSAQGYLSLSPSPGAALDPSNDYIAPLMANFQASPRSGRVAYCELKLPDQGPVFFAKWVNVVAVDQKELGRYSFMVIINAQGRIVFLYRQVPELPFNLVSQFHPVQIGLSSAVGGQQPQRVVDLRRSRGLNLTQNSVIVWDPLPTCQQLLTCLDCVHARGPDAASDAPCEWCPTLSGCSSISMPSGSGCVRLGQDTAGGEQCNRRQPHQSRRRSALQFAIRSAPGAASNFWMNPDDGEEAMAPDNDTHLVNLTLFRFPIDGLLVSSVTVDRGGRILVTAMAPLKFYIVAPLAADTTSMMAESVRWWAGRADMAVVEWQLQHLFHVQCILYKNGNVRFLYKNIHASLLGLDVGILTPELGQLGDPHLLSGVRLQPDQVQNGSSVTFVALSNCPTLPDCFSCLSVSGCSWCGRPVPTCQMSHLCPQEADVAEPLWCPDRIDGHFYSATFRLGPPARGRVDLTDVRLVRLPWAGHTVLLSFPFPFFGQLRRCVQVFPKFGLISVADDPAIAPDWPLELSYVTPWTLRLDADRGQVFYLDDGRSLTVEWHQVSDVSTPPGRNFSFSVTLSSGGGIEFRYHDGLVVSSAANPFSQQMVAKIGLASADLDAFFMGPESGAWQRSGDRHLVNLTHWASVIRPGLTIHLQPASQPGCGPEGCPASTTLRPADQTGRIRTPYEMHHKFYRLTFSRTSSPSSWDLSAMVRMPLDQWPLVLQFDFPFYGHPIREVIVMAQGYISLPSVRHASLAETQYVAPLMAAFWPDPASDPQSGVWIASNESALMVLWNKMRLNGSGPLPLFTFSAELHRSGDIQFKYLQVPLLHPAHLLVEPAHPVAVGLSDAYHVMSMNSDSIDTYKLLTYHILDLTRHLDKIVGSKTVVHLEALPTCQQFSTCWQCLSAVTRADAMDCVWCPGLGSCSYSDQGLDRRYQMWSSQLCYLARYSIRSLDKCPTQLARDSHPFYNVSYHLNPPAQVRLTPALPTVRNGLDRVLPVQLPFAFLFYQMTFVRLFIHPDGFVTFQDAQGSIEAVINVCRRRLSTNLTQISDVGLGDITGPISNLTTFNVVWNNSAELTLHPSGVIVLKYRSVAPDVLVGLGIRASQTQLYQIQSPEARIQSNVVVRFDPLTSGCHFERCDQCPEEACHWCGGRCQEHFIPCSEKSDGLGIRTGCNDTSHPFSVAALVGVLVLLMCVVGSAAATILWKRKHPEATAAQLINGLGLFDYRRIRTPN